MEIISIFTKFVSFRFEVIRLYVDVPGIFVLAVQFLGVKISTRFAVIFEPVQRE